MKKKGAITALEAGLTLGFPNRRRARGPRLRFLGGHEGAKRTASTAANSGFKAFSAGLEALIFIPYNEKPIASSTYFGTMKRTVFSGSTIWQTRTSATSESSMTRSASDSLVRDASRSTIC